MNKQPNIIFVHVDQLKLSSIQAYGCKYVKTPWMDRVLKDSVHFKRSYASVSVCVPARTTWYTGLEPEQSGVTKNQIPLEDPDNTPELGAWLKEKVGYDTVYMGKWHVAKNNQDSGFTFLHGSNPVGEFGDTALARAAANFILNYDSEKPYFLNVGLLNPHDICYWDWAFSPAKFAMKEELEKDLPPFPKNYLKENDKKTWSEEDWRFYAYSYFRFVEMVDAEIGRIYRAYLNSPDKDNTVFIFSSDHGQGNGEHGWTTKNGPYEHSLNVPLAIIDPKSGRAFQDNTHYVSGVDIAPTICDYAGVEKMPDNTGFSVKPLVRGEKINWREHMAVSSSMLRHRVVYKGDYKLIYDRSTKKSLVFNLTNDPLEMRDLADDPTFAKNTAELKRLHLKTDRERIFAPNAKADIQRWEGRG